LKENFLVPEGIYLLAHSVGCLPKNTLREKEKFFDLWQTFGGEAWEGWLSIIDNFRHSLARLLNGHATDFCPQVNISSAVSKILPSLPRRKGRKKILISELDFPSVGFALKQAERSGYHVELLQSEDGTFSLDRWQQHLTGDVQLVLITHSLYGNSFLNPIPEIVAWAKERDIFTLVDIAHSAGVVPIDVERWNADFVVGSCLKWLCGGPGAGFLWANPATVHRFEPVDVGWFSHENPFEFDINHFSYADDARRFWGGTPSVLPYLVAKAGIDLINQIGVERIWVHNRELTGRLMEMAQKNHMTILTPSDAQCRGGTVVIGFEQPEKITHGLKEENIWVDFRPAYGVRFSPHIYNEGTDIEKVVKVIESL